MDRNEARRLVEREAGLAGTPDDPSNGRNNLSFTARIAGWSARHRWWVLAGSALVISLLVAAMILVGTELRDDDEGVGESGTAVRLMQERFRIDPTPDVPRVPSRTERLIFSSPSLDVEDPAFRSSVEDLSTKIRDLPHVTSVVTYYDLQDPDMVSSDRRAVLGWVTLQDETARHSGAIDLDPVLAAVVSANEAAPEMEIGVVSFGLIEDQFDEILDEDFSRILIISLLLGLGILILAFRALVAAVIPLALAIGGHLQRHRHGGAGKPHLPSRRAVRRDDPADGPRSRHRLLPVRSEPLSK